MLLSGGHGFQRLAVEADVIARLRPIAQLGGLAVDRDPAGADPLFDAAARSVAAAGKQFLKS